MEVGKPGVRAGEVGKVEIDGIRECWEDGVSTLAAFVEARSGDRQGRLGMDGETVMEGFSCGRLGVES